MQSLRALLSGCPPRLAHLGSEREDAARATALTISQNEAGGCGLDRRSFRRRVAVSVVGALVVTVVLGIVLAGRRAQFAAALSTAPVVLLLLATLLQVTALLARSEAWHVCICAAGGTVSRRLLFQAAGIGYLASVLNGSLGMATRIASLRRIAPDTSPHAPALVAVEVPIITVEVVLAAIFSVTLIGPLGIPWWSPLVAVAIMTGAVAGLRRLSDRHRTGLWAGLAVIRQRARLRMIAFTLVAVCAQIARNWLMLHAVGVNISVFGAMALLIAMFTLGQLPIGPSIGPAAAVLILGANGVALTAGAGVLLAVTGTIGSLGYATWAIADRIVAGRLNASPGVEALPVAVAPTSA